MRMADARIAGSLREVLTIKCTLELDFLFWTHHWEREREGKRGDEKKSTETIHTLVCQQGPPASNAPLGAGISSSRNAQTCEKAQRQVTIKEHDYTPGERAGLKTPSTQTSRSEHRCPTYKERRRGRNMYAQDVGCKGCLYVLSHLRKRCSFPSHTEKVGRNPAVCSHWRKQSCVCN